MGEYENQELLPSIISWKSSSGYVSKTASLCNFLKTLILCIWNYLVTSSQFHTTSYSFSSSRSLGIIFYATIKGAKFSLIQEKISLHLDFFLSKTFSWEFSNLMSFYSEFISSMQANFKCESKTSNFWES